MAKGTNEWIGGSFHNVTITATINDLILALGEPQVFDNSGEDKVNVEWGAVTEAGFRFTIYDWKEYRVLDLDEPITFHIGSTKGAIQEWEAEAEVIADIVKIKKNEEMLESGLSEEEYDALSELEEINKE